jgi:hypothetical protein
MPKHRIDGRTYVGSRYPATRTVKVFDTAAAILLEDLYGRVFIGPSEGHTAADAFDWGPDVAGSGACSCLAFALISDAVGEESALLHARRFADIVVSKMLPEGFSILASDVRGIVEALDRERFQGDTARGGGPGRDGAARNHGAAPPGRHRVVMPDASEWPVRIRVVELSERDARIDLRDVGGRSWRIHLKRRSFGRVGPGAIITVDRNATGGLTFHDVHGVPLEVIAWEQETKKCPQ